MTIEEIRGRVENIRKMADGETRAPSSGYPHSEEYSLWRDVLSELARGRGRSAEMAGEALKTLPIDFDRFWS